MMRLAVAGPPILVVALWMAPAAAQEPTLATVLQRAGDYVAEFERRVSSVVAEERYVQVWASLPRGFSARGVERRRELVSDFLLVRPIASELAPVRNP